MNDFFKSFNDGSFACSRFDDRFRVTLMGCNRLHLIIGLSSIVATYKRRDTFSLDHFIQDLSCTLSEFGLFQVSWKKNVVDCYEDALLGRIELEEATEGKGFCFYLMHAQLRKYALSIKDSSTANIGSFPDFPNGFPYTKEFRALVEKEIEYLNECAKREDLPSNKLASKHHPFANMLGRLQFILAFIADEETAKKNKFMGHLKNDIFVPQTGDTVSPWGVSYDMGRIFLNSFSEGYTGNDVENQLMPFMMYQLNENEDRYIFRYCSALPKSKFAELSMTELPYVKECLDQCAPTFPFAGAYNNVNHYHLIALPEKISSADIDDCIRSIAEMMATFLLELQWSSAQEFVEDFDACELKARKPISKEVVDLCADDGPKK
jgi:hypothetical protein